MAIQETTLFIFTHSRAMMHAGFGPDGYHRQRPHFIARHSQTHVFDLEKAVRGRVIGTVINCSAEPLSPDFRHIIRRQGAGVALMGGQVWLET